jgi:rare lipoprotein A
MTAAPVFVSSVVHQEQILHRVRLGPIDSPDEAAQLEQSVRLANLGTPRRVRGD